MNESKATRYQRLKRRAGLAQLVCQALLFAGLAVSPLVALARVGLVSVLEAWSFGPAASAVVTAAAVALLLGALSEAVGLPTGFYRTHLLDRRYGLTGETAAAWASGHLKAAGIRLAMWMIGAVGIYAAMSRWPRVWWAVAAGAFAVAAIAAAHLAPVLLLPAFATMKPLTREPLRTRLAGLAARAGAGPVGIYEWTLGGRARRANAALVGIGPARRILLADTLVAEYSVDEIEVVVAHELGHHVHHDAWKAVAGETAVTAAGLLVADQWLGWLAARGALADIADPAGLPVLVLAAGMVALTLAPVVNTLSRRSERQADRYALEMTGNSQALISTLRRLAAQHLAEEQPACLIEWVSATHPSPADRIAAARQLQVPGYPSGCGFLRRG